MSDNYKKDNKMSNDSLMVSMKFNTSKHAETKIRGVAGLRKITMSKVIAIAIDNELERDKPFEFDLTLPNSDDTIEYAYADEAGKILSFIKGLRVGAGLDILVMLRYDIGIPDKKVFLAAFKECLDNDVLESFKPKPSYGKAPLAEDYVYYRLKGHETPRVKRNKESEYNKYMRLKKKFGKEE